MYILAKTQVLSRLRVHISIVVKFIQFILLLDYSIKKCDYYIHRYIKKVINIA